VRQDCGLELTPGGSPYPCGPAVDPLPYGAQRNGCSRASEACALLDRSSEEVGGAIGVRSPAL
jgi:hypothetical protein